MCKLYSMTRAQDAIRQLIRIRRDRTGNLPTFPGIFPDQLAPVVHGQGEDRELVMMRWGFPPPPNLVSFPVTNVRNRKSPYWRAGLKPEYRCLVPVTSFSEYQDTKARKTPIWFALDGQAASRLCRDLADVDRLAWT